ncbi:MAG: hypothetical protein C0424_00060 [Sphingobacteriaceae bacterium]|nr:hypothetical protein [Sphingobacteriaceae bacterium]
MNISKLLAILAFGALLISCEPEEVFQQNFTPNTRDTVFMSGSNATFRINGASQVQQSAGFGFSCTDTVGTTWALATGNGVNWDPITRSLSAGANDTMLALIWNSPAAAIGTYTFASWVDAFCIIDIPGVLFRQYDPSGLTVNIVRITTDSIFGDYSGALREFSGFTLDPSGNLVPTYTGVVDSVSTVFGVKRNPC